MTGIGYTFTHGKGCQDSADSQSIYMPKQEKCQQCRDSQAGDVKGDFDFGVLDFYDGAQLTREQIRRDNGQATTVGQSNADAD